MRCVVCGSSNDVRRRLTVRGDSYGTTCDDGECIALAWDAYWQRQHPECVTQDDTELLVWQWRRRRAEVEGRHFDEAPPKSEAEKAIDAWIHSSDLELVARELE
jgi:hypothetical protein